MPQAGLNKSTSLFLGRQESSPAPTSPHYNLLFLLPILSSFQELGQAEDTRWLKGKLVIDDKIMIGAPIYLINTVKNGTVTDLQGYFELEVPKNQGFKIQVGGCICSTRPRPVRINSNEVEVLLNLRKCQVRKKVIKKASEASKHPKTVVRI